MPEAPPHARQPDRLTTPATAGIFNQPGKLPGPTWPNGQQARGAAAQGRRSRI